ncbi:16944_t:CDS:2 [Dentiscutata heterogama]|uniref:16944_t:CDS:1 n=1 Tax=Dentiscutata heterogama TaxID=1316150 RepID=A0ACA9KAA0_9GLOM|nr:16944_t:CDS:2 [Dentiscutata heterogama]
MENSLKTSIDFENNFIDKASIDLEEEILAESSNTTKEVVSESVQIEQTDNMEVEGTNNNALSSETTIQAPCLRTCLTHKPSANEEKILKQLEKYKDSTVLLVNVLNDLVESLSNYTEYWTWK